MRMMFLLAVLAAGLFYSYYAYVNLAFLSPSGRLGPGFFPRIVGSGIVALTLISVGLELRRALATPGAFPPSLANVSPGALFMIAMGLGYVLSLRYLGGVYATVLFLMITLSVINRGRHIQNALVSILVPMAIYVLFRKVLNASFPQGMLPLPF